MRYIYTYLFIFIVLGACQTNEQKQSSSLQDTTAVADKHISLRHDEARQMVDVFVDGQPFTTYRYDSALKKPVLFPIRSSNGTVITRGYPLEPRVGEQADHLHHVGHWLNHGVVNQVDFWASTSKTETTENKVYGAIVQREVQMEEMGEQAKLTYVADWISDYGDTLLLEETTFTFMGEGPFRLIDRESTLKATKDSVVFEDSKEGMMAIRVARFMEQAYDNPQEIINEKGEISEEEIIDNTHVKGLYRSDQGLEGDAVWGTRSKWVNLSSDQDSLHYSITIMDHPDNINHPTHWMARGYGLFAANPLGSKVYSEGTEELNLTLAPSESISFKYRILVYQGEQLSLEELEAKYQDYISLR
ncbi:PmoA family protein [Porifericola rhodea]|uniref:DUF6807 domain-containing protein n=1 Tax=Porifericola rhodea TaxID=930972 RepID=UPI0026664942|nr:PmoA family protein [Porifericola rhodea]WKN30754.1 PmoA family protein [Porifericola rhodea]